MTDADDIARRAREISARAERIAEDSSDADALREELDRLDAELAKLDDEQRRLDEDLRERGDTTTADASDADAEGERSARPAWSDMLHDLLSDVTERLSSLGSSGWSWRATETVERSVAVDTVLPVVIENRAGAILVETGHAKTVTVSAQLFAPSAPLLEDMTVIAEQRADEVFVKCDWPESGHGRHARLTVTVPSGASVNAATTGGAITIEQTHADATASTSGGAIKIAGTNGEVDARTAGGAVRVADHAGSVQVITSGGAIQLTGVLSGEVKAKTAGGSIRIDGVERASVDASTSGGSIRVRGRLTGESSVRTAGGSVTVSIPSDSRVRVDGKGMSSTCDFPDLEVRRGRIKGTLGDGSEGTIVIRTTAGSVTLAKT